MRYPDGKLNYCFLEIAGFCTQAAPWILMTYLWGYCDFSSPRRSEGKSGLLGSGCRGGKPRSTRLRILARPTRPAKERCLCGLVRVGHPQAVRQRRCPLSRRISPSTRWQLRKTPLYTQPPRTFSFKFHLSLDEEILP